MYMNYLNALNHCINWSTNYFLRYKNIQWRDAISTPCTQLRSLQMCNEKQNATACVQSAAQYGLDWCGELKTKVVDLLAKLYSSYIRIEYRALFTDYNWSARLLSTYQPNRHTFTRREYTLKARSYSTTTQLTAKYKNTP